MTPVPSVWPTLTYRDPRAALRFLVDAFAFTERVVHTDGDAIAHVELTWTGPNGAVGGVMFGAADEACHERGPGAVHVVVDDPDTRFEHAVAAGATVVREPEDTHGSRQYILRDPEGTLWSFGTWYE